MCLPAEDEGSGGPQVVPIQLEEVEALSSVRIYIPKDLRQADARALGLKVGGPHPPLIATLRFTVASGFVIQGLRLGLFQGLCFRVLCFRDVDYYSSCISYLSDSVENRLQTR